MSKKITIQELEEVAKVLKRPPVIWDNIHANDYDPRRLFLGPFDGRSTDIIPYVRGVLTNPNCEFEANYIPLHTLAQWSKSNKNAVKKDINTGMLMIHCSGIFASVFTLVIVLCYVCNSVKVPLRIIINLMLQF